MKNKPPSTLNKFCLESFDKLLVPESTSDFVDVFKTELFTGGTYYRNDLVFTFSTLQVLFHFRIKVTTIERVILVVSYKYRSFRKFIDISFLLLCIWSSILLISTCCTPFKVLDTVIIPDIVLVVDLSKLFWIWIRDEV